MNMPDDKLLELYIEKAPSISKVYMIAGEETFQELGHFMSELGAIYLRLTSKRVPLIAQKNEITRLEKLMEISEEGRDRIIELMQQTSATGVADSTLWERMQRNLEFEQNRVSEITEHRNVLVANFSTQNIAYAEECVSESTRLTQLLAAVITAAREELELSISKAVIERIFEQTARRSQEEMRGLSENLQRFMRGEQN